MSWNFDMNNGNGKKAEFTKFPAGITRIRILDDMPNVRWVHWMPQHKRTVNCPGKGCPICEIRKNQKANKETPTYSMSRRFAMNVLNYETEKVEIMEQGIGFFEDLRDLRSDLEKDNQNLQDAIIKVRRRGTGKDDTSYRLDIDKVEVAELPSDNIIALDEYFKPHDEESIMRLVNGEDWNDVFASSKDEAETQETVEVR